MALSVYLDTSTISAYDDERVPEFRDLTRQWLAKPGVDYKYFISRLVIEEIEDTHNSERKKQMLGLVKQRKFEVLKFETGIGFLADTYINVGVLPRNSLADAVHLAYATMYKIDYVVSWNFRHLVNEHRSRAFWHHNLQKGLHLPKIVSPGTLLEGPYI